MDLTITSNGPLKGKVCLPGDKSLSHRAALFAALAQGESVIRNFLVAGVTRAMLEALTSLGISWELREKTLTVCGRGLGGLISPEGPIDCGNSATTMRLLAGALAACGVEATLDGSPGLRRRPMNRIIRPLRQMGVGIEAGLDGTAPLRLTGRTPVEKLHPLDYSLPVASAQVKSCLLLAGLAGSGRTTLREPYPSRDHSERMLRAMGVDVHSGEEASKEERNAGGGSVVTLAPPEPLQLSPLDLTLAGDISSAAFLIVAALVRPGSQITIQGVGLNPGRTGLLQALLSMGADISVDPRGEQGGEPYGDVSVNFGQLHGTQVSGPRVVGMIDEFPAFAVAAACAQGITTVRDAAELRHKESDRISALCGEMRRLGVQMDETSDGFIIQGGNPILGDTVAAHGDHRLAMALAVAGLAAENPVTVQRAQIVAESFPEFASTLKDLGAEVTLDD
jgi:3-phosphoshikimate 1-carboxyvinyltransferase